MLTEVRDRSQITIPSKIMKELGINKGDKFEIILKDGGIFLCPVVVLPKDKMEQLEKRIKEAEEGLEDQPSFSNMEDLFKYLDTESKNV